MQNVDTHIHNSNANGTVHERFQNIKEGRITFVALSHLTSPVSCKLHCCIFNSHQMSLREMQNIILYKVRFNPYEITVNIENSKNSEEIRFCPYEMSLHEISLCEMIFNPFKMAYLTL